MLKDHDGFDVWTNEGKMSWAKWAIEQVRGTIPTAKGQCWNKLDPDFDKVANEAVAEGEDIARELDVSTNNSSQRTLSLWLSSG